MRSNWPKNASIYLYARRETSIHFSCQMELMMIVLYIYIFFYEPEFRLLWVQRKFFNEIMIRSICQNNKYKSIYLCVLIRIIHIYCTVRKLVFHFLANWMGYGRGDSFPLDFKPNGNPFGSKSKGNLSPRSYPIQCERNWKYNCLSVARKTTTDRLI